MYIDSSKRFAKVIKLIREAKNISQEELSYKANLHRTYISEIERGIKIPTIKTADKIANALDYSLSDILDYDESQ